MRKVRGTDEGRSALAALTIAKETVLAEERMHRAAKPYRQIKGFCGEEENVAEKHEQVPEPCSEA